MTDVHERAFPRMSNATAATDAYQHGRPVTCVSPQYSPYSHAAIGPIIACLCCLYFDYFRCVACMADPSSRSSRSQSSQHASKLLALKFIGDIVSNNQPISALVNRTFDTSDPSTLSHDDLLWLKSKDLQRFASSNSPPESRDSANKPSGRLHFDEASLPFPYTPPSSIDTLI
jgi:hypothetical protein